MRSVSSVSKPTAGNYKLFCEAINNISRKRSDSGNFFPVNCDIIEEPWLFHPSKHSHHLVDSDSPGILTDEIDIAECLSIDILGSETSTQSTDPYSNCEVTLSAPNGSSISYGTVLQEGHPVEEPWLVQPSVKSPSFNVKTANDFNISDQSIKHTENSLESQDEHQLVPEKLLPQEENSLTSVEDSVTTTILINSSICTMQRIAVLEDGKLVELLLEPVKNNVQCDSVYLGVVTKLVPHMGGAFVNIGGPRPSLMDIRPNREPFVFPPFCNDSQEKDGNGSVLYVLGENGDVPSIKTISDEIEEADDVDDNEVDDDLEEYVDDNFGEHENGDSCDFTQVLQGNSNGSIAGNSIEVSSESYSKQSSMDSYETQSPDIDDQIKDVITDHRGGRKWAHVQKGTKIIVQVVKEGLGTKGPTLTAYPKLRSRFWVLKMLKRTYIGSIKFLCLCSFPLDADFDCSVQHNRDFQENLWC